METVTTDVLVLGSGIAGLSAAIRLASRRRVLVVTKAEVSAGNTELAQGGIAAAIQEEDSPFSHFSDSMSAGDYLCREEALAYMVAQGPRCVRELIGWGARFDTVGGRLSFTREGAHRVRRVLHAHGDATGAEIQATLVRRVAALPKVTLRERTAALDLLIRDGGCWGAVCLDLASGQPLQVRAAVTVIATGGAGRLYRHSTNAATATGDGFAMAYRAGALLEDMEFVQFHPTSLRVSGVPEFLLSEALRGEGGLLRNGARERFMPRYHPMAELAPRDVVSRAIWQELRDTGTDHVLLDMTHFKAEFLRERFPNLFQRCLALGIDMSRQPIPVAPAAHFIMGGIKTDPDGRTSLRRLYACGEAACTGVHGANRLASNSLLEGLVFGRRTGTYIRDHWADLTMGPAPADARWPAPKVIPGAFTPELESRRTEFQSLMWERVGIVRSGESLQAAMEQLARWRAELAPVRTLAEHAFDGMLVSGLCIARAALERRGSRGGHYREDYPERGGYGNRHVNIRRGSGGLPAASWSE
ncbi:MAG TPA: L-aspartate oxidase [Acidobacteriota bacterium]|nr:L-aspartate oxidase [Acidobacteriota bacterium]